MESKIELGDTVSHGWTDGFDSGVVCKVYDDGMVDVFRPYVSHAGFSMSGGEGASAVICYIGISTTRYMNPNSLKLLKKSAPLR